MEQYLYADEYDDNEIKILTAGKLLEFFNKEVKRAKDLANFFKKSIYIPTLEEFIQQKIDVGFFESFDPTEESETIVCDLSPMVYQYILQEAKKVFDGISWFNTEEELNNVYHEKIKNLYDTVDFSEFVAYL